jgi:hypothetical protein
MIILNQGELNVSTATCSVNKQLSAPTYLWSVKHKLTNQRWRFIPYQYQTTVPYTPSYDLFSIRVDNTQPEVFTASTADNTANLHLIPGDYFVKVYEQSSTTNLNPQLSYDVVYETTARVIGTGNTQNQLISYTGNTDIFNIYKG